MFGVFGSVQRHEQTKQPFTWPVCFSVSELRLSFLKKQQFFFLNQTNWVCLLLCKPGLKFMSRARLKPVGWVVGASVFHRTYSRPAQVPPRE